MEKQILKDFAKWCDDKINFKSLVGGMAGGLIEAVDGMVFSSAINLAYEKCPEDSRHFVLSVMKELSKGNFEGLKIESIDKVVEILNTGLGDEREKIIIGGLVNIVFKLSATYTK